MKVTAGELEFRRAGEAENWRYAREGHWKGLGLSVRASYYVGDGATRWPAMVRFDLRRRYPKGDRAWNVTSGTLEFREFDPRWVEMVAGAIERADFRPLLDWLRDHDREEHQHLLDLFTWALMTPEGSE